MNKTFTTDRPSPWHRTVLRYALLALLCAALQALLQRYTLGAADLAPLSVVLGVAVAAVLARGVWLVSAAMAGVAAADLAAGAGLQAALVGALVLGLQALLARSVLRRTTDADVLQLDTASRLKRFVLQAAPAAAALGVLAGMLTQWGQDAAAALPLVRPQLASALGRLIADWAGIVVTAPVLLCWLARPPAPWRPRRRVVALPLVLLVAGMLPGFDQVARRDEVRLQSAFERDANARRLRVQQLFSDPADAVLAQRGVLSAGGSALPTALFDRLASGWMGRTPGLQAMGWMDLVASTTTTAANTVLTVPTAASVSAEAAGGVAAVAATDLMLRHVYTGKPGQALLPGAQLGPDSRLSLSPALRAAVEKALAADGPVAVTAQPGAGSGAGSEAGNKPTGQPDARPTAATLAAAPSLLVLQAVPPAAGSGASSRLVFGVVQADLLLAAALPDNDDPNVRVCLVDAGFAAGQQPQRLAGPTGCEHDTASSAIRRQVGRVALGARRFDLLISEPPTADNRIFTAVWLLALPAVVGAAMLSALLLMLTGRLQRIEDRVRERTAALSAEIDERRLAERALAVSEQRFRAIFDSVPIGVTVVSPQGLLVDVNPAFCTMMGSTAAELLGRPLADIKLPDVAGDDGTTTAVGGSQARRQRYLTTDGRVLQVAASLRTLHDADKHPVATVGALQDLTQVLRLREAERERDEAEVASRTKSEFLANLSHELRAPLNAIIGFAQMLGRGQDNADPVDGGLGQRHGLAQIRQAGWHLLDMINDVLDLSRMEAGSLRLTLEPVSLADLAQEAMTMVEPAALQAGVTLELSLSPQADRAQADPVRLRQVLINLLGNAVKYNRPGGKVTLRTRPGAVDEVVVEVEDTGIGMSETQIGELFTPFHRLGREQLGMPGAPGAPGAPGSAGTGIGLVICRKLCQMMGGELSVSSRDGEGSVFGVHLPRPVGGASRTVVLASATLVPQVSIGTVLYIEDSEADIALMQRLLLQRPGVTLVCARTAADGLAHAADADMVLLDLDLPDQPGIEVLRALRADSRMRKTPVVVVSAESRPQRIDDCFEAGAAQFLSKPLQPQQVLRAVDEGLNSD